MLSAMHLERDFSLESSLIVYNLASFVFLIQTDRVRSSRPHTLLVSHQLISSIRNEVDAHLRARQWDSFRVTYFYFFLFRHRTS